MITRIIIFILLLNCKNNKININQILNSNSMYGSIVSMNHGGIINVNNSLEINIISISNLRELKFFYIDDVSYTKRFQNFKNCFLGTGLMLKLSKDAFDLENQNAILLKPNTVNGDANGNFFLLAKRRSNDNLIYLRNWKFFTVDNSVTPLYYMYSGCMVMEDKDNYFEFLENQILNSNNLAKSYEMVNQFYEMPLNEFKNFIF